MLDNIQLYNTFNNTFSDMSNINISHLNISDDINYIKEDFDSNNINIFTFNKIFKILNLYMCLFYPFVNLRKIFKWTYNLIFYKLWFWNFYIIYNYDLNIATELLFVYNWISMCSHQLYYGGAFIKNLLNIINILILNNFNIFNEYNNENDEHILNFEKRNINYIDLISITSPLIYFSLVNFFINNRKNYINYINLTLLKNIKFYYNIFMSLWSFAMCYGIMYSGYISDKYNSYHDLICKEYINNDIVNQSILHFYISKYAEWIDTLFIVIFDKPLIKLHYYHHASTAFLAYINSSLYKQNNPIFSISQSLNTFVHTIMYLYYAIPAKMQWCKAYITKIQITQHILVLFSLVYSYINIDCNNPIEGTYFALILYSYYLLAFINFYIKTYILKKNTKNKKEE